MKKMTSEIYKYIVLDIFQAMKKEQDKSEDCFFIIFVPC